MEGRFVKFIKVLRLCKFDLVILFLNWSYERKNGSVKYKSF